MGGERAFIGRVTVELFDPAVGGEVEQHDEGERLLGRCPETRQESGVVPVPRLQVLHGGAVVSLRGWLGRMLP